ncbi:MAG TPA: hypothetical protein DDW52_25785 [Planctomycetaceae bacterium]|nr:hypothetical protein [Planctomycetaceae bacterium]
MVDRIEVSGVFKGGAGRGKSPAITRLKMRTKKKAEQTDQPVSPAFHANSLEAFRVTRQLFYVLPRISAVALRYGLLRVLEKLYRLLAKSSSPF